MNAFFPSKKASPATGRALLLILGLATLLVGCTTLPKKTMVTDSYLVLLVENKGTTMSGANLPEAPFLVSNITSDPIRLKPGMNFIKLPLGMTELRLQAIHISDPTNLEMPSVKGYLGYNIRITDEGSILLVAKKLRYFVKVSGNSGRMVFETADLEEAEVEKILKGWRNEQQDKNPAEWTSFQVARPETTLP